MILDRNQIDRTFLIIDVICVRLSSVSIVLDQQTDKLRVICQKYISSYVAAMLMWIDMIVFGPCQKMLLRNVRSMHTKMHVFLQSL